MLSQERRSQLDEIVLNMSKQNAPQSDVQAIVNDFKSKYESETPITNTPHAPNEVKTNPEWDKKTVGEKFQAGPTEIVKGFGKGVLNTLDNASQIGYDILKKGVADPLVEGITGIKGPEQQNYQLPKQYTEATNNFQSIGKGIEQIGEFFVPAGLTAKLAKIGDAGLMMTKLATEYGPNGARAAKALSFLTRSGLLAGEGAGVTKLQTYGDENSDEQTQMNAIISGALPLTAKVLSGVIKPVLKITGEKIENALIKPSQKDIKDGFKIENLSKYDVGGSLEQVAQKTHNKIEELGNQLNQVIKGSTEQIHLPTLIDNLESEMTKNGTRTFGMNTKLGGAIKFFRDEIGAVTEDGNVSIADAQQIKRSVGKLGAWQYGARDPESTAIETVANNLYTKLKNEIEKVSPIEIRDINKQMSELIPIENAVIRRIPIADRNNMISLTDVLTAAPGLVHPSNLWLFFLNRLSKSGTVGNALMKAGQKVEEGKGVINELLYGPNKNTILTPGEQNAAGKVSTILDGMKSKGGMSIEDVSKKKISYKDDGQLSTKILGRLEGKTETSKQYISDLLNSGDIKKSEADLIRDILNQEKGNKVNIPEFANKVKSELLPLKQNISQYSRYSDISLPNEIKGDVSNYREIIYESPVSTKAGDSHYVGETNNYFGHTRVEDIAPEWKVGNTTYKSKGSAQIFGNPLEQPKTRRVIEVQSDLYQKNSMEREFNTVSNSENEIKRTLDDFNNGKITKEKKDKLLEINEYGNKNSNMDGFNKLNSYNNPSAHFRMIREEVKKASEDGVKKLQFPTGETAMKIEGLGERPGFYESLKAREVNDYMKSENLKVGKEIINRDNSQWIITDILGDGKFKAIMKERYEMPVGKSIDGSDDYFATQALKDEDIARNSETFDISGKIDIENPIYKFYEKEVGKYLKNNYKAELVTDKQGVNWWEVNLDNKGYDKKPVTAFGFAKIPTLLAGASVTGAATAGASTLISKTKEKSKTEFKNPLYYNEDGTEKPKEIKHTIISNESNKSKTEFDSDIDSAISKYPRIEKKMIQAIIDQESSLGKNTKNEGSVKGKYSWLVGFTEDAKNELERNNIPFNLDTKKGAIEAATAYLNLKKDYKDKNGNITETINDLVELYVDRYNANPNIDKEKLREMFKKKLEKYK